MKQTKKYLVINYNKKLKKQIHVVFYIITTGTFGKGFIDKKETREYNNIYHYICNFGKQTKECEIEYNYEVVEQKTDQDILAMYDNLCEY